MAANYDILDQYKNDTFDGVGFTLQNEAEAPIDLTGASIKIQFRHRSRGGAVVKEITNVDGITIENAANGMFKIDSFIIDWTPELYYYDVEIIFNDGTVKTYIQGKLKVIQDITHG